jgi:hypothetical protein
MLSIRPDRLTDHIPTADFFPFFEASPAGARRWLDSLTNMAPGTVAQQLTEVIDGLNHFQCTSQVRFSILQALANQVVAQVKMLSGAYSRQNACPTDAALKAFQQTHQLLGVTIEGYCQTAQNDVTGLFGGSDVLIRSLHSAMALCNLKLFHAALFYSGDEQPWELMHRIVHFSRIKSLFDTTPPEAEYPFGWKRYPVEDIYIASLLFSVARPFQLTQAHMRQLYQLCPHLVHMVEECDPRDLDCTFAIRPYANSSPTPVSLLETLNLPDYWGFSAEEMRKQIEHPKRMPKAWHRCAETLQAHVRQSLLNTRERRSKRQPTDQPVCFCMGIQHIAQALSAPIFEQDADGLSIQMPSAGASPLYTGHMVDISPEGMQIQWELPQGEARRIMVGDLIGAIVEDELQLYLIRWLKKSSGQVLRFGLEMIGRNPVPCVLDNVHKAVLLKSLSVSGASNLLTNHTRLEAGETVQLHNLLDDQTHRVQLSRQLDGNGLMRIFRVCLNTG